MSKDIAASVKQRLFNFAKRNGDDFNLLQVRYATERLLYRLSVSSYGEDFLLKGAVLFILWESHPHRPTKDIDLLSLSDMDRGEIESVFRKVASTPFPDDGLVFDPESVRAVEIRDDNAYGGIRVKLKCNLGSARIPVQVDVGLGDAVYPDPEWVDFPVLLDLPAPRIRSYPATSVIAEKFHAMVELGIQNSRMKDYYDIHYLLKRFSFDRSELAEAINQTFRRRRTMVPDGTPTGLKSSFYQNEQKLIQWRAFLKKNGLSESLDLEAVCQEISGFLLPVIQKNSPPGDNWKPGEGWS